jgi:DNA-binding transcriptional ArsR family regulator
MPRHQETSAFTALADPTRRAILKMLRAGSKSAGAIAEAFHLTKPTLSHHFRVLRSAGLVRAERRGTSIVYTLQTNVLEDLATELLDLAAPARAAKRST